MTNAELIQTIRAEIERLKEEAYNSILPDEPKYRTHYKVGKKELCEELLSFLDTLESEKPMNQEGLEEEIERYWKEEMPVVLESDLNDIARHFAKWGAEHAKIESENPVPTDLEEAAEEYSQKVSDGHNYRDLRVGFIAGYKYHADHTPLPEDTVIYQKGVAEGKRLMMKEAVEHYVVGEIAGSPVGPAIVHYDDNLTIGDKVRVIVLKKED